MKLHTLKKLVLLSLLTPAICMGESADSTAELSRGEQSLKDLKEGNIRYIKNKASAPGNLTEVREYMENGQAPKAIIMGCSDSRVPPEIVFDHNLGDLFVVRTAGHVVSDIALASIEYAVEVLNVPLIVVLGHQNCGAVEATVVGKPVPGHISNIANAIEPTVLRLRDKPGNQLDNAVRGYTRDVVSQLNIAKPIVAEKVSDGEVLVVGGYYNLATGEVELLKQ